MAGPEERRASGSNAGEFFEDELSSESTANPRLPASKPDGLAGICAFS